MIAVAVLSGSIAVAVAALLLVRSLCHATLSGARAFQRIVNSSHLLLPHQSRLPERSADFVRAGSCSAFRGNSLPLLRLRSFGSCVSSLFGCSSSRFRFGRRRARPFAARASSPGSPKFRATRSSEDASRSFALLAQLSPHVCAWQHVECVCNLFYDRAAYSSFASSVASQQSVIAQVINLARDSFRAAEDVINRAGREYVRAFSARYQQSGRNIFFSLFHIRQRPYLAAQRDALFQLS